MRRTARNDDRGVTNVVSMIMIIGIVTALMGMVFATYLPAWGKDIEVQTQLDAQDSFYDLKSAIDTLAVGGDAGTSLTTKFRLGSEGGPLFGFGRSSASLRFDETAGSVLVTDQGGSIYGQGRGNVVYSSNHLYVEDQDITLENGAIIKNELGIDVLKGPPNFVVKHDINTGETTVFITLMTLESNEDSISGTQSIMITTVLLTEEVSSYIIGAGTDITLRVTSDHQTLWSDLLRETMTDEGLIEGVANDFTITTGTDIGGNDYVELEMYDLDTLKVRSTVYRVEVY